MYNDRVQSGELVICISKHELHLFHIWNI